MVWFLWLLNGTPLVMFLVSSMAIHANLVEWKYNFSGLNLLLNLYLVKFIFLAFRSITLTTAQSYQQWQELVFLFPLARKVGLSFRHPTLHTYAQLGMSLGKVVRDRKKLIGLPYPIILWTIEVFFCLFLFFWPETISSQGFRCLHLYCGPQGVTERPPLGWGWEKKQKKKTGRKKDYSHNLQLAEGPLFLVFWPEWGVS